MACIAVDRAREDREWLRAMQFAQVPSTLCGCVDAMWAPVTHDLSCDATLLRELVAGTNFLLRKIVLAAQQVKRRKRSGWGRGVGVRGRGSIRGRGRPLNALIFLQEASVGFP